MDDKELKSVIKAMKRASREEYGFVAPRTHESKKAYKRSRDNKKIDLNDEEQ